MYEANIKEKHLSVFNERLQRIKPYLDEAKKLICSNSEALPNNVYITGGCASWLIGRTDTFEEINIYLLNRKLSNHCYQKMFKEYMACKDTQITLNIIYDIHPTDTNHSSSPKYAMVEFTYSGIPTLKFGFSHLDIHGTEKWLLDFEAISVFINLYDLNEIRTTECQCNYESKCTVTNNGCMRHGRVVYPIFFDRAGSLSVDSKFKDNEDWLMIVKNIYKTVNSQAAPIKNFCLKRFFIYPKRLFIKPDLIENRILTFCEYSCLKCKKRNKLTKKYADIWWHKTYAPDGYGCKAAARRFKGIESDSFKQYCTC